MKFSDIAKYRLSNQQVARPEFDAPEDLVRWFGAVQAQDYREALWAVGLRTRGATEALVEQAIAERRIVRTWPMRGTLHFVPPDDAQWMLQLLTARVITSNASRYRRLALEERIFRKAEKVVVAALRSDKVLTRPALAQRLSRAGVDTSDQRGLHIVSYLAQRGVICFGPRTEKQQTFVLLDAWVPNARVLDRREALGELARRYFRSHGPALPHDFAWWAGITVADARVGIEAAGRLVSETIANREYWFDEAAQRPKSKSAKAFLLPTWDEYTVAYRDRSPVLSPTFARQVNTGGGILNPVIVMDAQVIGTWKKKAEKDGAVTVSLAPFGRLSKVQSLAVQRAAERFAAFRRIRAIRVTVSGQR